MNLYKEIWRDHYNPLDVNGSRDTVNNCKINPCTCPTEPVSRYPFDDTSRYPMYERHTTKKGHKIIYSLRRKSRFPTKGRTKIYQTWAGFRDWSEFQNSNEPWYLNMNQEYSWERKYYVMCGGKWFPISRV